MPEREFGSWRIDPIVPPICWVRRQDRFLCLDPRADPPNRPSLRQPHLRLRQQPDDRSATNASSASLPRSEAAVSSGLDARQQNRPVRPGGFGVRADGLPSRFRLDRSGIGHRLAAPGELKRCTRADCPIKQASFLGSTQA